MIIQTSPAMMPPAALRKPSIIKMIATTPGNHISGVRSAMRSIQFSKFQDIQNQLLMAKMPRIISMLPAFSPYGFWMKAAAIASPSKTTTTCWNVSAIPSRSGTAKIQLIPTRVIKPRTAREQRWVTRCMATHSHQMS